MSQREKMETFHECQSVGWLDARYQRGDSLINVRNVPSFHVWLQLVKTSLTCIIGIIHAIELFELFNYLIM